MSLTPLKSNPPSINSLLQANPGDRLSADKSEIAPVVAILSRQLPLPQSQQLAGQTLQAKVLSSAADGQAQLDVAGLQVPVKLPAGRILTAGEMLTVRFALQDKTDSLGARETTASKKTQDIRALLTQSANPENAENDSPSFVDKVSQSARLISFLGQLAPEKTSLPTTAVRNINQLIENAQHTPIDAQAPDQKNKVNGRQLAKIDTAQLAKDISGALAKQVSSAVENSGLFYESHLQEWALGQRSKEQLAMEPQAKFSPEQIISDKGLDASALNQSAKLVTAQLATLDQSKISLALGGLLDKPIQIDIEPDQANEQDAEQNETEQARPWVARLKLDMANLGELEVRVRLLGSRCDVKMLASPTGKQALDPHWKDFESAMQNKGLTLVHGQIIDQTGGMKHES